MQFAVDGYVIEGDAIELAGDGSESLIRVGDGSAAGAGYTATIASNLTGAGSLVKTDLGTLILEGDNTYQGGTELRNGTLSVSSDTNLGAASGDITFAGGMLASTASFDSARAVVLGSNGLFDVADATTLGLSGTISGAGDLVKRGTGTLELSGDNAYGNTLVEAGTLIGDAGTISGNIGNAGTVVFDQAADTSFAGDIVGIGGSTGTMIKRDAGTLTLAGSSRLDWTVDAGGLVSATNRFVGDLAIGADGGFTFDQAYAGSYAGTISGAGALLLIGGGAVTLTSDSSGFVGTTALSDMTLVVNDALGGSLSILDGGRLEGIGTVGTTTVASGGTLAPRKRDRHAHRQWRSQLRGRIALRGGSKSRRYGQRSFACDRECHCRWGVLLPISARPGEYELRSTYTILSADGSLSGAFDDVTSDFAFLTPGPPL
ncbi:autotransporter-associated beta strand repeat-containing protein (plasmid) [Sinorhizobium meliloti]|nr:autotransporter-associated beta strand repeat-containing protein [Sinorhizobium meliloti]